MIKNFISFLNANYEYKFTNGYEKVEDELNSDSDFDILFRKKDFENIESIIFNFSLEYNYYVVQIYHQGLLAKNIFLYDKIGDELLNLDLYGQLSRHSIKVLNEDDVFKYNFKSNGVSVLRSDQEFIQYLIKKIDKLEVSKITFDHFCSLYQVDERSCDVYLSRYFSRTGDSISKVFQKRNYNLFTDNMKSYKNDFLYQQKNITPNKVLNFLRILKRIFNPTGISICFLGPDGSGKSTIINRLLEQTLPFRRTDYFHLKPIIKNEITENILVTDPQSSPLYSQFLSYIKLIYFFLVYNFGWIFNIIPLEIKSSLVVFDRYYDDILADNFRFRYGGSLKVARFLRLFIIKPKIYFILTANADVIYKRKQEVSLGELNRQIAEYRKLGDGKRYFNIDVDSSPELIVKEVKNIIMDKMNGRY